MPKEQKVSEFVSGKTIFWGRATEAKWDRKKNKDENSFEPYTYNVVEIIKPLKGQVGKKVKVWNDPSSCGTYIPLGKIHLYVVNSYPKNSFYTDQIISYGASDPAIIAYFNDGINVSAKGSLQAPYVTDEEFQTKCQSINSSKLPNFCIPKETVEKIYRTYENEYETVKKLANKKPWWTFR